MNYQNGFTLYPLSGSPISEMLSPLKLPFSDLRVKSKVMDKGGEHTQNMVELD